ncbi:hypothetical protein JTB14_001536 [Gonioctena quinquepunctata]|nr:hypothetical protein JTB14_001536 [Gonioctena quinquepunctata]
MIVVGLNNLGIFSQEKNKMNAMAVVTSIRRYEILQDFLGKNVNIELRGGNWFRAFLYSIDRSEITLWNIRSMDGILVTKGLTPITLNDYVSIGVDVTAEEDVASVIERVVCHYVDFDFSSSRHASFPSGGTSFSSGDASCPSREDACSCTSRSCTSCEDACSCNSSR